MKKLYIAVAVVVLCVFAIVYFENASRAIQISFLGKYRNFTNMFPTLVLLGIIMGGCITLLLQQWLRDMQDTIDNAGLDL